MSLENYNIAKDARSQGAAKAPILYMEDGSEIELPMGWQVCPVCDGKGSHVNPSIDAGGISREQFEDDPDFAEQYWNGTYDQTCTRCNGRTTVPAVNWEALTEEQRSLYQQQLRDEDDWRAEQLAEIRAGC